MKAVVEIACAGPFALARFDRLLQRLVRRALSKIEQRCRTAVQCGTADLLGRRAQQVLVAAGERDRHAAMDMRIDAAGYDDLTAGVDGPLDAGRLQTARRANSGDLAPGDADFRPLRASRRDCGAP